MSVDGITSTATDHDLLVEASLRELVAAGLDVLGSVVGSLVGASEDDVRGRVALSERAERRRVSASDILRKRETTKRTSVSTMAEMPCLVTERKVWPVAAARMASTAMSIEPS